MNGSCVIEDSNRTYQGAFFGQTVTVHANASIQHVGFVAPPTGWETPTG
jgi:UDP-3-O-[3-hydroxymyristoyl] glucosamine N-acyltransferase